MLSIGCSCFLCIDFFLHGMKHDILIQSWSVIVRIESNPCNSESLVMKSSTIVSKGSAFSVGYMGLSAAQVG